VRSHFACSKRHVISAPIFGGQNRDVPSSCSDWPQILFSTGHIFRWLDRFRASLPTETPALSALEQLGVDVRPLRDRPLPDTMLWNIAANRLLRVALRMKF
jgi:hypothetical protein